MNNLIYNDSMFTPGTNAAKTNPRLGIVVMDYVNKQLCRRIIDRNTFPSSSGMKILELINPGLIAGLSADGYELDGFDGLMLDPALYGTEFAPYSEELPAFETYEAVNGNGSADIVWPVSADLTYGYVLGEATLHFAEGAAAGREGTFQFVNEEEILAATETTDDTGTVVSNQPVSKMLTFTPADGGETESHPIPVTVHKRPLPIKIGNIEAEYGGEPFSRADIEVTAGGYLLESDLRQLPQIIESEQIHWVLTYEGGGEIPLSEVPPTNVVTRGTIALKAENVSESAIVRFPNYAYTIELGTWEIVPRTVTVVWNYIDGSWQASIGNVVPGDEVYPVMSAEGLTLGGAKADCYQVAEEDLNPPDYVPVTPSAPAQMPQKEPAVMPFTDIAASHYAKDAIQWAWENGYCDGVSAAEFAPDQGLSRAMLVTILWRMAEQPHEISSGFRDVPDGKWYSEAIAWAASLDLVSGAAPGLFVPDAPITREQLAVILWRYAGSPKASAALSAYSDGGQVSAYAREAMAWAVEAGILTGANGRLMPKAGATRAQAVLMLQRFDARMREH